MSKLAAIQVRGNNCINNIKRIARDETVRFTNRPVSHAQSIINYYRLFSVTVN